MNALKSCALLWILITGLVFHFMLSKFHKPEGIFAYSNFILHYASPVGMLLNWLIFEKKGGYKYRY
ncbi:MAG TPA: Pr6Pr family membrane protein, partial [Spirochaetota bacterium]|nr:Pr6Pr family membrane protein [Spirochaetota bacterium]